MRNHSQHICAGINILTVVVVVSMSFSVESSCHRPSRSEYVQWAKERETEHESFLTIEGSKDLLLPFLPLPIVGYKHLKIILRRLLNAPSFPWEGRNVQVPLLLE